VNIEHFLQYSHVAPEHTLAPGRIACIHVIRGRVSINGVQL
jgi:hypothetical protein